MGNRTFFSLVAAFLFLLSSHSLFSQPSLCPNAGIPIDSTLCSTTIHELWAGTDTTGGEWEVMLNIDGTDTTLIIDPSTITFSGASGMIDMLPAVDLFDHVARRSVVRALSLGLISGTSCSSTEGVTVLIPACVVRYGSGVNTTFLSIDECELTSRVVSYCPSGGGYATGISSRSGSSTCTTGESTLGSGAELE